MDRNTRIPEGFPITRLPPSDGDGPRGFPLRVPGEVARAKRVAAAVYLRAIENADRWEIEDTGH